MTQEAYLNKDNSVRVIWIEPVLDIRDELKSPVSSLNPALYDTGAYIQVSMQVDGSFNKIPGHFPSKSTFLSSTLPAWSLVLPRDVI